MGSAIASDSRASARTPNALTNVRTALGADAIATALIENLHCLQGKLPWQATRNYRCMALAAGPAVLLRVLLASGHHPLACS
jgi:glycogen phosphorylase